MPGVAVVIPCRNEAATIEALLDALAMQDCSPDEVLVVDDGSTDGTAGRVVAWRQAHPERSVTLLTSAGRGVAAALNTGIRRSRSDVILRLDGHCRPALDYLRHSVDTLASPGAGIAGGVWEIEPGADTRVARAIAAAVSHPLGSGGALYRHAHRAPGAIEEVDTVPFGCFPKALWQRVGGYDETLAANEDYEFNYRLRRAGYRVLLNTRIRSVYRARPTLRAAARQYFRYGFWKTQMLRKAPASLRFRQAAPALLLPWLVAIGVLALSKPGPFSLAAATLYPAIVTAAGLHIASTSSRPVSFLPAVAALATIHLTWSAGFWWGLLRFTPPHARHA